jgi:hypothetical protein
MQCHPSRSEEMKAVSASRSIMAPQLVGGGPQARPAWLGLGFAASVCLAGALGFVAGGRGEAQGVMPQSLSVTAPAVDPAAMDLLLARLARLEAALPGIGEAARHAETTAAAAEAEASRAGARMQAVERQVAERGRQAERFVAAALLLQASIATPRPFLREFHAMADLAPQGALSRTASEALLSHAARGVPTEAELRERFSAMMPQLMARAPRQGDALDSTLTFVRGGFATVGLAAPPPPSDQEQAIAGVAQQLRRGNLAGAVSDAGALDASLQPLLAGWLAHARARLAVEQAVQETLLHALVAPATPS